MFKVALPVSIKRRKKRQQCISTGKTWENFYTLMLWNFMQIKKERGSQSSTSLELKGGKKAEKHDYIISFKTINGQKNPYLYLCMCVYDHMSMEEMQPQ